MIRSARQPTSPGEPGPEPRTRPPPLTRYVLLAAAAWIVIEAFTLLSPILLALLLIFLISLALNPLIARMRVWTGGRSAATGLVVGLLLAVVGLTGWAFLGPMKASVGLLAQRLPDYWERLQKPLIVMEKKAVLSEEKLQAEVTTEMAHGTSGETEARAARPGEPAEPPSAAKDSETLRSRLIGKLTGLVVRFSAMAFDAAQILVVLLTVFVGVTVTLTNPRPIVGAVFALVPERHHARTLVILQRIARFLPRWAGATLLGMLTVGLLVFLLMWPILGATDALVLGLIAFVLEAIPFIGPVLSAVPAVLLAMGQGGMSPLYVVLAYVAVQVLDGSVILPLIMARGMRLHPLAVSFSMLLCIAAFGLLGVLIAAPLVAIVAIVHGELYRKRFLPNVTDEALDSLAGQALCEPSGRASGL